MSDDDKDGDKADDIQQTTDEKSRVAETPESDPRGGDSEGSGSEEED